MNSKVVRVLILLLAIFSLAKLVYHKVDYNNQKSRFSEIDSLYKNGEYVRCKEMLFDLTEEYPNENWGWTYLGTVHLEQNEDSLAEIAYLRSIAIEPNAKSITGLGVIRSRQGRFIEAKDYYNQVISTWPSYGKAYSSLMIIEFRNRDFKNAAELGEKAVQLDSVDLGMRGNLMIAYHLLGRNEERDSLLRVLEEKKYRYLDNLKLLISGQVLIDEIL